MMATQFDKIHTVKTTTPSMKWHALDTQFAHLPICQNARMPAQRHSVAYDTYVFQLIHDYDICIILQTIPHHEQMYIEWRMLKKLQKLSGESKMKWNHSWDLQFNMQSFRMVFHIYCLFPIHSIDHYIRIENWLNCVWHTVVFLTAAFLCYGVPN